MHIIIDLGANDGCSIKKFKTILNSKNITDYKIYSFEPHPYFYNHLRKYESDERISIIPKIAYTKDCKQKLYVSTVGNDGSSIYSDKTTNGVSVNNYVECDAIDIVEFIHQLPKYETLWVKMDIEGGEYDLIPYLHSNHVLPKIDTLFIEWHYEKIQSISREKHDETVAMVKNVKIELWDALEYRELTDQDYRKTYLGGIL